MEQREFAEIVINTLEDLCYILDKETYEILFMNNSTKKMLGLPEGASAVGRTCYSVFYDREKPCESCINASLEEGKFQSEEVFNEHFQKYIRFRNTKLTIAGKEVWLLSGKDMTESYLNLQKMQQQIDVERTAMECIRILIGEADITTGMEKLLSMVAVFYGADRGYIMEFQPDKERMDNTYEWCREGVEPEKEKLQNLPIQIIDRWMAEFKKKGAFFITMLEKESDPDSEEYRILEEQGVNSLIAAPMMREGAYVGLIGVDNPTMRTEHSLLIQILSSFVLEELEKRRLMGQLEKMSYFDALTGAGNRNYYIKVAEGLQEHPQKNLGIVYADINGLKKANDTYGHRYGDQLIQRAAQILKEYLPGQLFRVGGDEFISINPSMEREVFEDKVAQLRRCLRKEQDNGISVGMNWQENGEDVLKQISYADQQMYEEKQSYYKLLDRK